MTNWACDEVTCFPTNSLSQETYDSSRSENFQKHCISQFVLSTGRRAVNAEEHYSMAVMGNTHFANFKSSENKISGGNCNIFCQTITIQYSKTTARTRHSRKRLQTKTRQGQSSTVTLVAFGSKQRFTQENKCCVSLVSTRKEAR